VLLLVCAWGELALRGAAVPANLALMILVYSALTWIGMSLFGAHVWLQHGEVFSLVFGLLARFAPTEVRVQAPHLCQTCPLLCRDDDGACIDCYACFARADVSQREWNVRPYAVGLARHVDVSLAEMSLVLVLLATVTFDSILATPLWTDIEHTIRSVLPDWGRVQRVLPRTLGLLGCVMLLLEVYVLCSVLMALASGRRHAGVTLARRFACTLVPLIIAYHVAHYLAFFLLQGQALVPLLSDPFGRGWDLLGTAAYALNLEMVGPQFAWYTMLLALVLGHSAAVYLVRRTTVQTLRSAAWLWRSQYPLLCFLVGSTVLSIWSLAQPMITDDDQVAPTTAPSRGPCQGFVVLPNGYAVLSGLSAEATRAHLQGRGPSGSSTDHLMGYRHGQEVTLRQGMLCVPLRDSKTTAWAATTREPGLSVMINSLTGPLAWSSDHPVSLEITLWDTRKSAPVDEARVRLLARMPHHDSPTPGGHGLANDPYVRGLVASPAGRGRYALAALDFSMPGAWLVEVEVQQGHQTQPAYFAPLVGE
jgi:hypothetical protein